MPTPPEAARADPDPAALCPSPAATDLTGSWIWLPGSARHQPRNSYAYFRRGFVAGGALTIRVAADTQYQLFLDGRLEDRGTAPADTAYKTFDTHPVTVAPGPHVLALLVHHFGQPCATAMTSRPGLFVNVTGAEGVVVVSDATWRTLPALAYQQHLPCMMSHFGFYEICDHEKAPADWTTPSFDDSKWLAAEVIGPAGCPAWPRLIPRDIPLLATRSIPAAAVLGRGTWLPGPLPEAERDLTVAVEMAARVRRAAPGEAPALPLRLAAGDEPQFAVIDFGREVTGHVRLEFEGAAAGQRIDLGYDETLDAHGLPNPRRTYGHMADRAYLRAGQREWSVFGGRGFRYLLIDVAAGRGGLTLASVAVDERTYPVARAGTFRCSDPELGRLYQAGLTTTRLCMLDTFVDCPGRERVMWMDLAVEAQCAAYGFGDTGLWRHCLYLFAQNVCRQEGLTGAIKGYAPTDGEPTLVSFTLTGVTSLADYHRVSGDAEACASLLPTALRQFELIERYTTPEGLLNERWPGWGTFLDWSAMDFGGVSSCNNALYHQALRQIARLARALGDLTLALQLERRAGALAAAYRAAFWSEAEGLFVDSVYDGRPGPVRSQLANVLAIWSGLTTATEARSLLLKIMDPSALLPRTEGDFRLRPGFKPQTGGLVPIGTPGSGFLLVQVLFERGLTQTALAYLRENWGPISQGGTVAEHFVASPNTSYCHGWGAGAAMLLPAYVLGVRPLKPGWSEIEIAPQDAGLDWAAGIIPAPQGEIHVRWEHVDGQLHLDYQVPPGITVVTPGTTR